MTAAYDIALLGWGTRGADQVTVEQLRALGLARAIAVDPGAPASIFAMLRAYGAEVLDLGLLYRDGREKKDVYPAMLDAVLDAWRRRGPTVWMTYGHPLVYSMPSRLLIGACRAHDLKLVTLSGISSLDEIMSVLSIDISERDLQVVYTQRLVDTRRAIDPTADLFLVQPGGLGETRLCRDPEERKARDVSAFAALQEHLLRFYPPEHRFTCVCLSDVNGGAHEVWDAPIARIVELAPSLHYGHTWFVRALP